ncbi:RagB/SusD family nutrient uptake outer membrane protein [Pedobacter sp. MW01-1-1]|uniref:RagB/SusD family nutrient uptake outer membrane protein n=1 Tax=Pedobacter sp. MW01-1-1 TaxID=3383027 RepID=UPI003FED5BCD
MKLKYIFLFGIMIGFSSCKKFLDTEPSDFFTPVNYYTTADQLQQALNGVYGNMMQGSLYGQALGYNFETADELLSNRGADGDTRGYRYSYNGSNSYVGNIWRFAYLGINNANVLLENINKPVMDETKRNRIKGQALFLRAYLYWVLTTHFQNAPLILKPGSINEVNIAAASPAEIYTQMETDLKEAETLLQGFTSTSIGYNDVVTVTAVQAMLARVYIYWAGYPVNNTAKYSDCVTYCTKVMNSGIHSLNPDYKQVFINLMQDVYDVKENILEWGSAGAAAGVLVKAGNDIGNFVGLSSTRVNFDMSSYASASWMNVTRNLFDAYEVDPASTTTPKTSFDLRRDWNCANFKYTATATTRTKTTVTNPWLMSSGKFRREYCPQEWRNNGTTAGTYGINWPVLRYSDVLLMYAEASNQVYGPTAVPTGGTLSAYDAINLVRKRGYGILNGNVVKSIVVSNGGSGYTTVPVVTIVGGGGAGATATARISGGRVTGIYIDSPGTIANGSYYTAVPTVVIAPPNTTGTTATATATITTGTEANLQAGLNKDAFQLAIRDERLREFNAEGLRKNDVTRWGNFYQDMLNFKSYCESNGASASPNGLIGAQNVAARNVVLPIPDYELGLNNLLVQNPGW